MKILADTGDEAVLAELGERLARRRLDLGLTQADLAREAGVAKRTVERIEAGASAQLASLIRVLRTLDLLPALDAFLPAPRPSPIELLETQGRQRERASGRRRSGAPDSKWTWGDES